MIKIFLLNIFLHYILNVFLCKNVFDPFVNIADPIHRLESFFQSFAEKELRGFFKVENKKDFLNDARNQDKNNVDQSPTWN